MGLNHSALTAALASAALAHSMLACAAMSPPRLAPISLAAAAGEAPNPVWQQQASGTHADLRAVAFSDSSHGWAVGAGGTILSTSDDGDAWQVRSVCRETAICTAGTPDRVTADLEGISFSDPLHGWISGARGMLLSTADGGRTWTQRLPCARLATAARRQGCDPFSSVAVSADLLSVSFPDAQHGWAVGRGEVILSTTDGGATWTYQLAPKVSPPFDLYGVSFADRDRGAAVGGGGHVLLTADGGGTWRDLQAQHTSIGPAPYFVVSSLGPVSEDIRGVSFIAPGDGPRHSPGEGGHSNVIRAAGGRGLIVYDGDKQSQWWEPVGQDAFSTHEGTTTADLNGVSFADHLDGVAVGSGGTIMATADGGASWRSLPSGTSRTLRGVTLRDANRGVAVGDGGTIVSFRSTPSSPAVMGVSPSRGPSDGRLQVVISGRGFEGAREVNFGKRWARGYIVDSDTQITALMPSLEAGQIDVTVVGPGATSSTSAASRFTVFDPVGGAWSAAGDCHAQWCTATPVRLQSGSVLFAGAGVDDPDSRTDPHREAQLFDPATGFWTAASSMNVPRLHHSVTLLRDGRVLVAGGAADHAGTVTGSAEIYDPATGAWTVTGSMNQPRELQAAVLLPDGRVLVAGGVTDKADPSVAGEAQPYRASAELFDPATGRWTLTGRMQHPRGLPAAVPLEDGRVLVVGGAFEQGSEGIVSGSAELYDPHTGRWLPTAGLLQPAEGFTLTRLASGRVLAAGGSFASPHRPTVTLDLAEVYDPATGGWQPTGALSLPRAEHSAVLLADGRVMVSGGAIEGSMTCSPCSSLRQTEIYDPATGQWNQVSHMPDARKLHSATLLSNGRVLIAGGIVDRVLSEQSPAWVFAPDAASAPSGADRPAAAAAAVTALVIGLLSLIAAAIGARWLGLPLPSLSRLGTRLRRRTGSGKAR